VAQEPEDSSPHSQQPATGPCPETVESNPHPPKLHFPVLRLCQVIRPVPRLCVVIRNKYWVLRGRVVSPPPKPQAGGPPTVGCPRLLIQYIRSYPPYLEAISSIRNPRTRHAVVTVSFHTAGKKFETQWFIFWHRFVIKTTLLHQLIQSICFD
jgi:hypothetical protein